MAGMMPATKARRISSFRPCTSSARGCRYLYSLYCREGAFSETQSASTAVFIIIDPVEDGRHRWASPRGAVGALLSATSTNILASCDGVNVYDGCCKTFSE